MKKIILFCLLLIIGIETKAQTGFVVTNFNTLFDTNWLVPSGHAVSDKLNANYGQIVGWLNSLNQSNSIAWSNITNLNAQLATNLVNILFLLNTITNLNGTNIAAGTMPTNVFSAATMAWLLSIPNLTQPTNPPTRYISTNLTLATAATILIDPPFKDTNFGVFQDLSAGLPTSLAVTGKTTNSISTTMGLFTGREAFGLIHQ